MATLRCKQVQFAAITPLTLSQTRHAGRPASRPTQKKNSGKVNLAGEMETIEIAY